MRDAGFLEDDHAISRAQNMLRYMRQHPQYLPPNDFPEAMMVFQCVKTDRNKPPLLPGSPQVPQLSVEGVDWISINEFEGLSDVELLSRYPQSDCLIFLPSLKAVNTEDDRQKNLTALGSMGLPRLNELLNYLICNRWYLDRSELLYD